MKGMIWNTEGLGDTAKHFAIQESIKENRLDFVALVETRRSNFSTPFLKQLAGGGRLHMVLSTTTRSL